MIKVEYIVLTYRVDVPATGFFPLETSKSSVLNPNSCGDIALGKSPAGKQQRGEEPVHA
jgi:hypothetical protein